MHRIGALIFPRFELLDLFGPFEMFGLLRDDFQLTLVAAQAGPVVSNQQVSATADVSLDGAPDFDILFVPGGSGTRHVAKDDAQLAWIAAQSAQAEYVLSVCTGSALLALAGVLDGRRATTNKAAFQWVADQGPNVDWVRAARWVEDGKFFTSSGVSAGMDMTLGFLAHLHGRDRALEVAKWCEYDWHQDAAWDPFARIHGLV